MKIFLTIFLSVLIGYQISAQDSLIYKTDKNEFVVKRNDPRLAYVFVYNSKNNQLPTDVDQPWTYYIESRDQFEAIKKGFQEAVRQVLKGKISELENQFISFGVYFDNTGTVYKITCTYKEHLPIEVEEIEQIETRIVGKLKFPLRMKGKAPFNHIHVLQMVKFSDL